MHRRAITVCLCQCLVPVHLELQSPAGQKLYNYVHAYKICEKIIVEPPAGQNGGRTSKMLRCFSKNHTHTHTLSQSDQPAGDWTMVHAHV